MVIKEGLQKINNVYDNNGDDKNVVDNEETVEIETNRKYVQSLLTCAVQ